MQKISQAHLIDTAPASPLVADQHLPDLSVSTLVADLLGRDRGLAECICYVRGRGWYRRLPSGTWQHDEQVYLDLQLWVQALLRGRRVDVDSWEARIGRFILRGSHNAASIRKELASSALYDQVLCAAKHALTRRIEE